MKARNQDLMSEINNVGERKEKEYFAYSIVANSVDRTLNFSLIQRFEYSSFHVFESKTILLTFFLMTSWKLRWTDEYSTQSSIFTSMHRKAKKQ